MPSKAYHLIEQAIKERKQIRAFYHGLERHLCPHALGYDASGQEQALFYQFAGKSRSGLSTKDPSKNWRCMELYKLRDVEIVEGEWHSAPRHSQKQTCVKDVKVEIDY